MTNTDNTDNLSLKKLKINRFMTNKDILSLKKFQIDIIVML